MGNWSMHSTKFWRGSRHCKSNSLQRRPIELAFQREASDEKVVLHILSTIFWTKSNLCRWVAEAPIKMMLPYSQTGLTKDLKAIVRSHPPRFEFPVMTTLESYLNSYNTYKYQQQLTHNKPMNPSFILPGNSSGKDQLRILLITCPLCIIVITWS